jgi:hypothetical protein
VISVQNTAETFFEDVELHLHLEGAVPAAEYDRAETFRELALDLPTPPWRWGPQINPGLLGLSAFSSPILPDLG